MARYLPVGAGLALSIYIATVVIRRGMVGAMSLSWDEATIIFLGLAYITYHLWKIRKESKRLPWEDEHE